MTYTMCNNITLCTTYSLFSQVCYDVSHLDHRIEHIDQRMIQDSKDLSEQLFALLFGSVDRFNAGGMRLTLFLGRIAVISVYYLPI